ncbi:MAG: hypothetical protein KA771_08025, partial [Spirochaetales bacterium]|nr:hypothetical protein [Spirochaetales bacterium]
PKGVHKGVPTTRKKEEGGQRISAEPRKVGEKLTPHAKPVRTSRPRKGKQTPNSPKGNLTKTSSKSLEERLALYQEKYGDNFPSSARGGNAPSEDLKKPGIVKRLLSLFQKRKD